MTAPSAVGVLREVVEACKPLEELWEVGCDMDTPLQNLATALTQADAALASLEAYSPDGISGGYAPTPMASLEAAEGDDTARLDWFAANVVRAERNDAGIWMVETDNLWIRRGTLRDAVDGLRGGKRGNHAPPAAASDGEGG